MPNFGSGNDHWNSPPDYLDWIYAAFDGIPDIDVCSNKTSLVRAHRHIILPEDGLEIDWIGNCFGNIPYSKPAPWVKKASEATGASVIILVHVATGSKWWRRYVWPGTVCFHHKRISFLDKGRPVTGNPRDSASIFYGYDDSLFIKTFSRVGRVVRPEI
jgi:hypothetical protein